MVAKLNEATFSEVFKFTKSGSSPDMVVKIIPLKSQDAVEEDAPSINYPLPISFDAAIHECKILKEISLLQFTGSDASKDWTGFNRLCG